MLGWAFVVWLAEEGPLGHLGLPTLLCSVPPRLLPCLYLYVNIGVSSPRSDWCGGSCFCL